MQNHLMFMTVKVTIVIIVLGINLQSTIKVCTQIALTIWVKVIEHRTMNPIKVQILASIWIMQLSEANYEKTYFILTSESARHTSKLINCS